MNLQNNRRVSIFYLLVFGPSPRGKIDKQTVTEWVVNQSSLGRRTGLPPAMTKAAPDWLRSGFVASLIQILLLGSSGIGDTGIHGICDFQFLTATPPFYHTPMQLTSGLSGVPVSPGNSQRA